ncbi:MAG TPA: tyrosine recombinase XerC [Clostridiaceae bacterium]|nr:tyrosine recombinase XerC [Clostridiaceae bacterium]
MIDNNNTKCKRLEDFLGYFQAIRERSPATIKEYRYDLTLFLRFLLNRKLELGNDTSWEEIDLSLANDKFLQGITLSDLYLYITWLSTERKNSAATRSRHISAIRSFFHYLTTKVNILAENPAANLEMPKQLKRLPRYLSLDDSLNLLEAVNQTDERYRTRDYAIITLFLNCGLRLSELVSINISDIREDTLIVMGKGGKERTVYLNGACIAALNDYYPDRITPKASHKDALFISRLGKRIGARAVQNIIRKNMLAAGIDPKRYSTHKLRHTAATLMYQYGQVDIRNLQMILGHESVATTEIYTHTSKEALHDAVERNPLSSVRRQNKKDIE